MKVKIDSEEWYPVFFMTKSQSGTDVEIDQETFDKWQRVAREFDNMQKEMLWRVEVAIALRDQA